jgi:hypothetical protein
MFSAVERAGYLGASDMPFIMNDKSPEQLMKWWETKVGLRDPDPPTWAMHLGSILGDEIIDEYQRQTGDVISQRQAVIPSPVNDRFRSTLDGFSQARRAVIEAKFVSPFFDRDQIFSTYYPQVAMQMHCTDAAGGFLVAAQGTNDPFEIECIRDQAYEAVLLERAAAMLESMDTLTPPVELAMQSVPVPPEKWRTVDLDRDTPNWGDEMLTHLLNYEFTREAADDHESAGKAAKLLVPDDVGRVLCEHHIIARNKKGALVITRRKS